MKTLAVAFMIGLTCVMAHASETDNVSRRELSDAKVWLNAKMNEALQRAVQKAKPGDPVSVHRELFKDLGGLFWAQIEHWANDNSAPALHIKIENSIFQDVADVKGDENFVRRLFKFRSYYSSGIFKVDETVFGADKLGHFLQVGYAMYFAKMKKENPKFKDARPFHVRLAEVVTGDRKFYQTSPLTGVELVYAYSRFQEDGSWGLTGPMARSYGDMAANVEGYHFWSELTEGQNPFIKMSSDGKRWQQVRNFDWTEYINLAWDEAVNRSDYHPRISQQVEARIQQVLKESCVGLPSCSAVFERYGDAIRHVFNVDKAQLECKQIATARINEKLN